MGVDIRIRIQVGSYEDCRGLRTSELFSQQKMVQYQSRTDDGEEGQDQVQCSEEMGHLPLDAQQAARGKSGDE